MPDASTKKIVMLISPNFGGGGAERSIANLSVMLADQGYDVHFVVFNVFPGFEQVYPIKGMLHLLDVPAGRSLLDKIRRFRQRVYKVSQLKKNLRVDVSISFLEGADYVNIISRQREKVIVSIRGSKENDKEIRGAIGWVRKKVLIPWLYNKADSIVCVSAGLKAELDRMVRLAVGKTRVIHNYYNMDEIRSHANESLPPYAEELFKHSCVITSGRLHPQKNHLGLIRSLALLKKDGVKCKLVILGSGDTRELIEKCEMLGLSVGSLEGSALDVKADVFFLGYQNNPWRFIKHARIFVLSSSWEGFPNSLAEAMCLGIAVISTDCPHGPAEILTEGLLLDTKRKSATITKYGALIPMLVDDEACQTCADVINEFLSDDGLRRSVGEAAVIRISDFSEKRIFSRWQNVIEDLEGK